MNLESNSLTDKLAYNPKIIALVGSTCSGKTQLALHIARKIQAHIFSLDSLSIYKNIDIASAKPSKKDREGIRHFALNVLSPDSKVNAGIFIDILHSAVEICKRDNKPLLIVGGSSFYLKSIINGLSPKPKLDNSQNALFAELKAKPIKQQYEFLCNIDSKYASNIKPTDSYRILRGLEIFALSNQPPSLFFKLNPPKPFPLPIICYNLLLDKDILHKTIERRTSNMLKNGIICEAQTLLRLYGDNIQPFKSIGLKECLQFLQGKININDLESLINIHTKQLAKRQRVFNKTQFHYMIQGDSKIILESILDDFFQNSN